MFLNFEALFRIFLEKNTCNLICNFRIKFSTTLYVQESCLRQLFTARATCDNYPLITQSYCGYFSLFGQWVLGRPVVY